MSEHWQVAKVTVIDKGELWYETVSEDMTQRRAEELARKEDHWVAIPTPYDPTEEERGMLSRRDDVVVDHYGRGLTDA